MPTVWPSFAVYLLSFHEQSSLDDSLVNSLERVEDELELRQVVIEPLRTMFVAAKEVL